MTTENDTRLTSKRVADRFGVSLRTIERWGADEKLAFPKPVKIRHRKYWSEREISAWDREHVEADAARGAA
jgi:predicted DNA-binding transcriptional regulator AlpA